MRTCSVFYCRVFLLVIYSIQALLVPSHAVAESGGSQNRLVIGAWHLPSQALPRALDVDGAKRWLRVGVQPSILLTFNITRKNFTGHCKVINSANYGIYDQLTQVEGRNAKPFVSPPAFNARTSFVSTADFKQGEHATYVKVGFLTCRGDRCKNLTSQEAQSSWRHDYKPYDNIIAFDSIRVDQPAPFQSLWSDEEVRLYYKQPKYYSRQYGGSSQPHLNRLWDRENKSRSMSNLVTCAHPPGLDCNGIEGFDEIYAKAPAAKMEIDILADEIAARTNGLVAKVPIKSLERAQNKIINDYGGDPTRISDLARNTIIVSQDKIPTVAALLRSKGASVKVIDGARDPLGYSGINSKIETRIGLTGEIQVNSPEMIYAKEAPEIARILLGEVTYDSIEEWAPVKGGKGHIYYERWRSLEVDDPRRKEIESESKNYYNKIRPIVMPFEKSSNLDAKDIYIDYPYESVMFRRGGKKRKIFRKFYGESESLDFVPHDNRLFNDALLYGEAISRELYLKGKGEGN
ncbi:hypothetical protein [uncultured Microbulbifer sp.]|uniref:hypothetical protein n=1 Tax=uncultured Microbulbifer sp. TaxID=348147 RepID=UPI0026119317|nr:hypothetical protein [uncultured Microbulbifer sp.]